MAFSKKVVLNSLAATVFEEDCFLSYSDYDEGLEGLWLKAFPVFSWPRGIP
jgi:hypothetical protein